MRKHLFLMGWEREGRTSRRVFEAYISCIWPLHEDANERGDAKALLAMIDGEANLAPDVKQFCDSYFPMTLRCRYAGADVTGPYLINDTAEEYTRETLEKFLDSLDDDQLKRYLCRPIIKPIRR